MGKVRKKKYIPVEVQSLTSFQLVSSRGESGPVFNILVLSAIPDFRRRVEIFIGNYEAFSILWELNEKKPPRPMTHDLLAGIIQALEIKVGGVFITELHDNTFYAEIHLKKNNDVIDIDTRPSDAVAIALRVKAPIFVSESLLYDESESQGFVKMIRARSSTPHEIPQKVSEEELEQFLEEMVGREETEAEKLERLMWEAADEENYEEAARIRDRLRKITEQPK